MSSGDHTTGKSHYLRSSYRESLVEHLFVGSLLKHFWNRDDYNVEVLNPQVDDAGYDLVIEHGGVIRHVQLKATFKGAKTAHVNLNAHLAEKPSGCVVAVVLDPETLDAIGYGWFGGPPRRPLPEEWEGLAKARHAKGNAAGVKTERPNIRKLPYSRFEWDLTLDELAERLFGKR